MFKIESMNLKLYNIFSHVIEKVNIYDKQTMSTVDSKMNCLIM